MTVAFHWIKLRLICYATEREEILRDVMEAFSSGENELTITNTEGHHGNPMVIMELELSKNRQFKELFKILGPEIVRELKDDLDRRVEDDCTLYFRLDKQEAVQGRYVIVTHGDVISVVAKAVSHPARKEIALTNLDKFFEESLRHHN